MKNEVKKGETINDRNTKIIADYTAICSKLSKRLDEEQDAHVKAIDNYKVSLSASYLFYLIFYPIINSFYQNFSCTIICLNIFPFIDT